MVDDMRDGFKDEILNFNDELQTVLKTGFDKSAEEVYDYLSSHEKESHTYAVKELKNIFAT